ncbi:Wall-associated receptor kinase [Melia azedarach]|uniref:Wall-associated receptor kinase n=1 Tax=Melia azedarach TaxID=155640 RepID=A0ACC1YLJ3_MELAZ|nr:Wall-associated receptor kinase [Melia azedarach]
MITKMESMFWFMLLLLWPTTMLPATGSNIANSDRCLDKCGEVVVPYPFGIDDSNCARNEDFLLHCNSSSLPAKLMLGENIYVLNVSVENGTILASIPTANRCYNGLGGYTGLKINVKLGSRP